MTGLDILIAIGIFIGGCVAIGIFAITVAVVVGAIKSIFKRNKLKNMAAMEISNEQFEELKRLFKVDED